MSVRSSFLFVFFSLFTINSLAEPIDTLNWVGCGISKKAYVTDLSKAFEEKTNIHINIQGGGATKGIRTVVSGEADLGGSCRYQLPHDPREAGVGLSPVAWDALVVITHKDNVIDNLTLPQVYDIYTGNITNWKQLGGPDAPIEVFTRKSKFSGVGRTFRKLIFADFDKKLHSTRTFKSSGPLEKAIIESPNAIAITGISSARLRDVKILKLGGVDPSYENIKAGQYQLYRPLYITYNPDSAKIANVKKFIRFTSSAEGRRIMRANGTLPYREGISLVSLQVKQDLSAFRKGAQLSVETLNN
ncbi:MAG: phosphate ABC transporter substrate-binding protein [Proteobacteria bacterium]|nr:phosphate ABC transporter substrate-binding protein [Pseudomonadota bacterium]